MTAGTPAEAAEQETLEDITAWLDEKPGLARYVGAARKLEALRDREPDRFKTRRVMVLRNFTIEPIEPLLRVAGYRAGLHIEVAYSGYEPGAHETFDTLGAEGPDVVVLALRLEELAPSLTRDFLQTDPGATKGIADSAIDHVVTLARSVRERTGASLLVHNFVAPLAPSAGLSDAQHPNGQLNLVRAMNIALAEEVQGIDGAHLLDVDHLFSGIGLAAAFDVRGSRMSGAPLSQAALRALADSQVRHIKALAGPAIKCVVVDCDNTLWGGVVGEEGVSGIALGETGAGAVHHELQLRLLDLRRRGIVLAIASKNNEADVLEVLRTHPDSVLTESDFAAMRVNWEDKASNIASIAAELNLNVSHLAFIDDNPVECEWVRGQLPAVKVIQWPGDLGETGSLDDTGLFDSLVVTDEDRKRTEMYQAEGKRRAVRAGVGSVEDYLRSLEMQAVIGSAVAERLPRLAQLTQKTNQFNLTTRRHDLAAMEHMLRDDDTRVVWLDLRDRFGGNGVIGCAIVRREGSEALIDTLLLSCRVIGRGAESVLLNRVGRLARDMGATTLVGEYIPSERNSQVADLYTRLGFTEVDGQKWHWDLAGGAPPVPDWFEIIDADGAGE